MKDFNILVNYSRKDFLEYHFGTQIFLESHCERWDMIVVFFIIKGFWTIIFIVISTSFRLISPPAFFMYLTNSETFTEL